MSLYKSLRNIVKKYLPLTVLSGVATFGGCSKKESNLYFPPDFQVSSEVQKRELESKVKIYHNLLTSAGNHFKESILNGQIDKYEQEDIYRKLRVSELFKEEISKSSKLTGIPISLQTSSVAERIYSLLEENLNGFDLGTPELEKVLKQSELNIKVEKCSSKIEVFSFAILCLVSLFGGTLGYACYRIRKFTL